MGTDIHAFVEVRDAFGEWRPAAPECDEYGWLKELPLGRDYALFGGLAGVRGSGPAISQPRGLPVDVSPSIKAAFGYWEYQTTSWLTLKEICDHNWGAVSKKYAADEGLGKLEERDVRKYLMDAVDTTVRAAMSSTYPRGGVFGGAHSKDYVLNNSRLVFGFDS